MPLCVCAGKRCEQRGEGAAATRTHGVLALVIADFDSLALLVGGGASADSQWGRGQEGAAHQPHMGAGQQQACVREDGRFRLVRRGAVLFWLHLQRPPLPVS